jgi:hypothetical protein
VLKGKVDPNGNATKCSFEYGKTTAYESGKVPCAKDPGSGQFAVAVEAEVKGLSEHTEYHYRVVAEYGSKEEVKGGDLHFKTGPNPPAVRTKEISALTTTSVTLNAGVNPEGSEVTECVIEYGTTTAYEGGKLPCSPAPGSGTSEVAVAVSVSGLTPGTPYHYRVFAKNSSPETSTSADATFSTESPEETHTTPKPPPPPPEKEVDPFVEASPNATIAGSAITVSSSGSFSLKITCPVKAGTCTGTVVVKTAGAVGARSARAGKKVILTLASGSFSVAEGQVKTIALHLSAKARKLLAKTHTVRGKATITAHNKTATPHTGTASVTLRAVKKKH